ncbi:hypothetical protein AQUCO_00200810v1 [Aquilegia coerulea]|uniref:Embryo defective n=1 Tax=Aquilegia coerulea TaxID=218851 RepID=A0A2G5F4W7_AQUCA|nr:hypothetical protein AQUCO_00200810v1 [Aquilegia coerulea]
MAEAVSAKPPLLTSYFSQKPISFLSKTNFISLRPQNFHQSCLVSQTTKFQLLKPSNSLKPINSRNLRFSSSNAYNGEEGGDMKSSVDDESEEEEEEDRGESSMPGRFRHLTKEVPDRPIRWPYLIPLPFGIYAWRTVLWELSNWKKGFLAIGQFLGYLLKLVLAVVLHFIGPPVTSIIRCVETALYTIQSVYSGIVAAAPVQELTVIILLTSTLLAIAEAVVPDSANSQPYLLTLAGIVGLAAVTDFIPELVFWLLLMGIFCFSRFFKKRDLVTSLLPAAAALSAVGQPWLRLVVITSYVALAISHHSKKLSEGNSNAEATSPVRKLPAPLLVAALTIGIHLAARWIRYRHLTWMIV